MGLSFRSSTCDSSIDAPLEDSCAFKITNLGHKYDNDILDVTYAGVDHGQSFWFYLYLWVLCLASLLSFIGIALTI